MNREEKRKRQGSLARCAAALLCLLSTGAAGAQLADEPARYELHIAEKNLGDALTALSRQSRTPLLYPYDLAQETGLNPVDGRYTLPEALKEMFEGTNFSGAVTESGVIAVSLKNNQNREAEMNTGKLKTTLLAGAAAFLYGTGAYGADVALIEDQDETICAEGDRDCERDKADEIVVTGTNIRGLPKEYLASPTFTYDAEDIRNSGFGSLSTYLNTIPQNFGGGFTESEPGAAGLLPGNGDTKFASPSLRGIGADATLTLFNGRRLVNAGYIEAPTVSFLPAALTERVEILVDGASATYGADAVGGVVNIVTKRDFDGVEVSARAGTLTNFAQNEYSLSGTAGKSWDTGNIYGSVSWQDRGLFLGPTVDGYLFGGSVTSTVAPEEKLFNILTGLTQEAGFLTFTIDGTYFERDAYSSLEYTYGNPGPFIESFSNSKGYGIFGGVAAQLSNVTSVELLIDYQGNNTDAQRHVDGSIRSENSSKNTLFVSELRFQTEFPFLSAGPIQLASGAQYRKEKLLTDADLFPAGGGEEEVLAGYAEAYIPLVSDSQAIPFVNSLTLSLAGRYESFGKPTGANFAPKLGLRWGVTEELSLRGTYSESFLTPRLSNTRGKGANVALFGLQTDLFQLAQDPRVPAGQSIVLQFDGDNPDLVPQEATTFTVGFDYATTGEFNFNIGAGYYNVNFGNRIDLVSSVEAFQTPGYGFVLDRNLAPGDAEAFLSGQADPYSTILELGLQDVTGNFFAFYPAVADIPAVLLDAVQVIQDTRPLNFAQDTTSGIDFYTNVSHPLLGGDASFSLSGQYILKLERQAFAGTEILSRVDTVYNPVDLSMNATLGWRRGPLSLGSVINYTDSLVDNRVGQDGVTVDSYTFASLYLTWSNEPGYGLDWLGDATFGINVSNVTNAQPPKIDQLGEDFLGYDALNAASNPRRVIFTLRKGW